MERGGCRCQLPTEFLGEWLRVADAVDNFFAEYWKMVRRTLALSVFSTIHLPQLCLIMNAADLREVIVNKGIQSR